MEEKKNPVVLVFAPFMWSTGKKGYGMPSVAYPLYGLARDGFVVHVLLPSMKGSEDRVEEGVLVHERYFPFTEGMVSYTGLRYLFNFIYYFTLTLYLFFRGVALGKKTKADVIYGHTLYAIPAAWLVSKVLNRPYISRLYGTYLYQELGKRKRLLKSFAEVLAFKIPADRYIITNDGTRGDKVAEYFGLPKDRLLFWVNGVDMRRFSSDEREKVRRQLGISDDEIVVITASRLVGWKRVDLVLDAFIKAAKREKTLRLFIVGDGPMRKYLEKKARESGMGNRVTFVGEVSYREVERYMNAADIFMSAYMHSNVGNPLLEALKTGKAIITMNNGDTGRFIRDGETGILVEEEEWSTKVPELLVELARNPNLRERLSENAASYADEHLWTWDERVKAEVEIIRGIYERYRKRRIESV